MFTKKQIIISTVVIVILITLGLFISDKIIKRNNYENECKELLTDMDSCFANEKCHAISHCPEFTGAKTACCPKGLFD